MNGMGRFILSRNRFKGLLRTALFLFTTLGFLTSIIIFNYISLFFTHHYYSYHLDNPRFNKISGAAATAYAAVTVSSFDGGERYLNLSSSTTNYLPADGRRPVVEMSVYLSDANGVSQSQHPVAVVDDDDLVHVQGKHNNDEEDVFHDSQVFLEDYREMNKTMKIFIYPHTKNDPFTNVFSPPKIKPTGNYASKSYFKRSLFKSHFITKDPSEADLFYLPFSIATLRNDKRVGVGGIPGFIRDYISNISRNYPYWNRTDGADHFYVACHSVGRTAMEKARQVKFNAIQVVCSSSYFLHGYIPHKDVPIPQIWPRTKDSASETTSKRKTLAFYAGAMNSRERKSLVKTWGNDSDLSVHATRLKTPYSKSLLGSKYCIHAKGFEVNTARVADAIYYGCVPVILADYYDLPFDDVLNWKSFSVVVSAMDVPLIKRILQEEISYKDYLRLHSNVARVRKHFQWHGVPVDFDAFHMIMYELWIRRSNIRMAIG